MATVRELITRIAFRIERGKLQAAGVSVGRMKKQMRQTAIQARSLGKNINGLAAGAKLFAAAFIGSRILKLVTTDFANSADAAAKFSTSTGVSIQTYQALGHAVELSGGSLNDLNKGLTQVGQRALQVSQGNKTLKRTFDDIGVTVTDASGKLKNQDQLLFELADRFKAMKDGSRKTGLAMQLFGRTGATLIPLFNEGSKGIKKMTAEAKRLGIVLTKEQAAIAENFNDELLRSKSVLIGVRNQIAIRLLPALTRALTGFKEWATEGDNLQRMLTRVKKAAIAVTFAFIALKATKLGIAFAAALPAIKTAAILLGGVARAALAAAAPLLVPIALIAALALAIEDLVGFAQGRKSLIGDMFGDTAEGMEVRDLLREIGRTFRDMGKIFAEVRLEFLGLFKEIAKGLGQIIRALLPVILKLTIGLLRIVLLVVKLLAWAVRHLVDAFNWLVTALEPVGAAFEWLGSQAVRAANAIAAAFIWAIDRVTDGWNWLADNIGGIWDGLADAATSAANAIAAPFLWAWKKIKEGWDWSVGKIIKAIDWIVDKVTTATNALAALTGRQKVAGAVGAGITAATGAAGAKTVNQTTKVTLGSIGLTVQGTASMSPEQMEAATGRALRQGLNDWANDLINNRRPVVEGATG